MKIPLTATGLLVAILLVVLPIDSTAQSKKSRTTVGNRESTMTQHQLLVGPPSAISATDLLERMRERHSRGIAGGAGVVPTGRLAASTRTSLGKTARLSGGSESSLDFSLRRAENGTVSWLRGKLGEADLTGKAWSAEAFESVAQSTLESYKDLLRLEDPAAEMVMGSTRRDELGFTHTRFTQTYRGVPVWNADLIVHFDDAGSVYAINGSYIPTPKGVVQDPVISWVQAKDVAVDDLDDRERWAPLSEGVSSWLGLEDPAPELVIYPDPERGPVLAWDVSVHSSLVERYRYVVDANSGDILNRISEHCTIHFESGPALPPPSIDLRLPDVSKSFSAEFVDAQGVDLNGQTTSLRVYAADGGPHFMFWDLDNIGSFNLPNLPENGGAVTLTANNQDLTQETEIGFVTSDNNTWSDASAISAHANMKVTYDYFKGTFGRKAINDADQSIVSITHVTRDGQSMGNAYWNGRIMAYGDGDATFKPLAGALDVAAHEMAHGVIQGSADLVYQNQPGALNESFADVFGVMNDREDFLLGEDVMQDGHTSLRDLLNPDNPEAQSGDPAAVGQYTQPAHMNDFRNLPNTPEGDNGGVHINSGIPNRAAALIIQALGHDVTEQIYYRGLTQYLTRNSQFGDARSGLIQAAEDLHGSGSTEANAVAEAFDAVGVTGGSNTSDPTKNDVPTVSGGSRSIVAFVVADGSAIGVANGTIGFYDPYSQDPNGFLGVFSDPGAVARLGSQLSSTTDGSGIWFINADGFLSVIDLFNVDASTPDAFAAAPVLSAQDIFIQQAGDLFNAAVGPIGVDENDNIVEYAALTSAYDNDPTLYFTDLNEIYSIEIKPSTSAQGVESNLVRYPDVVSWSPNPYQPKVAFDALNSIPNIGSTSDYWTIYELDFNVGQIYNLIPAQPVDVSVGNIAYSNTNPDIVAFNVVTGDGFGGIVFDIYLADFETGETVPLELPSITDEFGDSILPDAERPTFAPDDSYLAFASASLNSLIFMDSETGELSQVELVVPPFNPHWFVVNADVSDVVATNTEDETEIPTSTGLLGNYPNPFSGSSTIRYGLNEASRVSLEVFDALGRSVSTLVDDWQSAGSHEYAFNSDRLTPGAYMVRLSAGDRVFVHKMLVTR